MTTPGDESRTELAWREIVEHYGERPVLPDDPADETPVDDPPDGADDQSDGPALTYDAGLDEEDDDSEDRDVVPAVERFQPPAAPPFPRPRTWQRGVAWAGVLVTPVVAFLVGLLSIWLPPLLGWAMVAWFVGGFLYLVREMPRAPRDPWDDGSRV